MGNNLEFERRSSHGVRRGRFERAQKAREREYKDILLDKGFLPDMPMSGQRAILAHVFARQRARQAAQELRRRKALMREIAERIGMHRERT